MRKPVVLAKVNKFRTQKYERYSLGEEVLLRVNEQRNVVHEIRKRKCCSILL